jgi:polysaccharide export outer membrane protein
VPYCVVVSFLAYFKLFLMKIPEMQQILRRSSNILCRVFLFFIFTVFLYSCVPAKKFVYLHNLQTDSLYPREVVLTGGTQFTDPTIQTNDILSITVQTLAQNEGNAPVAANSTTNSSQIGGFLVDKNGYVELSLIGFVKVVGLTTTEARELIKQKAKEFYKDPVISVRIANFEVIVTGDVTKVGPVNIPSEKASILDVLALAGDLNVTAKRKNVLLVRREGDETKFVRFDLTSTDIYKSPYFYLKQRDYIYVEPNNFKRQTSNNLVLRYISYGSGLIGVVSILFLLGVIK